MDRRIAVLTSTIGLLLLSGCRGESSVSPSTLQPLTIQDVVNSVTTETSQATARPGQAPAPSGGPTISVTGNQTVINGGTLPVGIAASAPFDTIYIVVGAKTVGLTSELPGGIAGYYELRLPGRQTAATAVLAFPQTFPIPQFDLLFAVADSSGPVGPFASLTTTPIQVGTGDVQVTLSWDADSDVDLHVVDPSGEEIYYGHKRAASGGQLDLDSNAACDLDHKRNENITWAVGRAPRGQYTVRVDYWDSCRVTQTNYTVRINNGGTGRIVTGSFTGSGDQGAQGSGRFIATFERTTGPTALSGTGAGQTNPQTDSTKAKASPRSIK